VGEGVKNRAVFLDRDGVINRAIVCQGKPYPPRGLGDLEILPGVEEAVRRLRLAGFKLLVVTNQPDVARGNQKREDVERMNAWLGERLALDGFKVCYHDDGDGCGCRKPKPGMLLAVSHELQIDLKESFMIGDRWRDIEAGNNAGCRTIFIDYGYDERQPLIMDARVYSLPEAVDWILGQ